MDGLESINGIPDEHVSDRSSLKKKCCCPSSAVSTVDLNEAGALYVAGKNGNRWVVGRHSRPF